MDPNPPGDCDCYSCIVLDRCESRECLLWCIEFWDDDL
jgi:hypothetical protein